MTRSLITHSLIAGSLIAASLTGAPASVADYISPADRYKAAISDTRDKQDSARQKYAVKRTKTYVEALDRSKLAVSPKLDVAPPPSKPPVLPPSVERLTDDAPRTTTPRTTAPRTTAPRTAGSNADMEWVRSILTQYGLPEIGSWSVDGSGSCAHLPAGKWAGCTWQYETPRVKIAESVIGTEYGMHTVVHEWMHAAGERNECEAERKTHEITGRTDLRGYNC